MRKPRKNKMRTKFLLNLILSFFIPITAIANNVKSEKEVKPKTDANITGHIVNAAGEHLPYITVIVKGTNIGTSSDATGHYMLKDLPLGDLVLEVQAIGYKKALINVRTKKNTLFEVNFELEEDPEALEEVVVSATRNETSKKKAPIIVNVASTKLFETTAACRLTEVMNFQPGLRIENNCGNCGTSQLRINGLEGQYSQILIDSRPVFSSLAGVYGLDQLPLGMIERIEIIRGGGSALFGSSAIGGVVNIITKEPIRNTVSVSNTTNFFSLNGFDINHSINGSFVSDNQKAGVYVFGAVKDRSAYDRNNDDFSDIPKLNSETLGFRGFYKTSAYSRITAEYHRIHEYRRGGNNFSKPPHEADIAENLSHKIDGGSLRFNAFSRDYKHRADIFVSAQRIARRSYFGVEKSLKGYGTTKDMTFVGGGQYTLAMDKFLFMPAELTAGVEYSHNALHDIFPGLNRDLQQTSKVIGAYLQNEWKNDKLSLLLGGRFDKHNMMGKPVFSPRANVRWSPTKNMGFRASYSAGYRAPQAYDEDLHIEAVGGSLSMIELAKDLKPEYSHSVSASADLYHNFGRLQTNLVVEGFYTRLVDVFQLDKDREEGGIIYWKRVNGEGATVAGVNLEGKAGLPGIFEVQFGYTYQSSLYDKEDDWSDDSGVKEFTPQRKMPRTPSSYGYITSNFNITPAFTASVFGNYTGSMLVRHTVETDKTYYREKNTPAFWDMGVKLAYVFKFRGGVNFEVNTGVKNIFDSFQKDLDTGVKKDAAYVYGPLLPRMVFVGAKFTI